MSAGLIDQFTGELSASRQRLERVAAVSPSARRLARLIARLEARLGRPPRVVLLGEFNSGKTTLANALIGADVLPTSIHANTRIPIHVHYSPEVRILVELPDRRRETLADRHVGLLAGGKARMLHVGLAVERLKRFELIDTPGLASGNNGLDAMTLDACRVANIAIWCTASTQAWKASEQAVWSTVPVRLHRKGMLVATLADALNTERDRMRVEARLRGEALREFAGLVMVTAAEVDELRRDPQVADYAQRWVSSGGEALDRELERLVTIVWGERRGAIRRILTKQAEKIESAAD
jgi:GTPase SAR1 family protein